MEIKTANDWTHTYTKKSFKRYLKDRSTRSLRAIFQTKRLDAGFFWLEFWPLVRDIFLAKHPEFTDRDLDILLQLHANQPFSKDDLFKMTIKPKDYKGDWSLKTHLGIRTGKTFLNKCLSKELFVVWKNHTQNNQTLYVFNTIFNSEFRSMYDEILCLTKIRNKEAKALPSIVRKSKTHMRKILKQNSYKEKFEKELDRTIYSSDKKIKMKLRDARPRQPDH